MISSDINAPLKERHSARLPSILQGGLQATLTVKLLSQNDDPRRGASAASGRVLVSKDTDNLQALVIATVIVLACRIALTRATTCRYDRVRFCAIARGSDDV